MKGYKCDYTGEQPKPRWLRQQTGLGQSPMGGGRGRLGLPPLMTQASSRNPAASTSSAAGKGQEFCHADGRWQGSSSGPIAQLVSRSHQCHRLLLSQMQLCASFSPHAGRVPGSSPELTPSTPSRPRPRSPRCHDNRTPLHACRELTDSGVSAARPHPHRIPPGPPSPTDG